MILTSTWSHCEVTSHFNERIMKLFIWRNDIKNAISAVKRTVAFDMVKSRQLGTVDFSFESKMCYFVFILSVHWVVNNISYCIYDHAFPSNCV